MNHFEGYKLAPGYVLVRMDPKIEKSGDFLLPEEENVNRGTVIEVSPKIKWGFFREKPFVGPRDRIVIGQIRQQVDKDHVIVHLDSIFIKV